MTSTRIGKDDKQAALMRRKRWRTNGFAALLVLITVGVAYRTCWPRDEGHTIAVGPAFFYALSEEEGARACNLSLRELREPGACFFAWAAEATPVPGFDRPVDATAWGTFTFRDGTACATKYAMKATLHRFETGGPLGMEFRRGVVIHDIHPLSRVLPPQVPGNWIPLVPGQVVRRTVRFGECEEMLDDYAIAVPPNQELRISLEHDSAFDPDSGLRVAIDGVSEDDGTQLVSVRPSGDLGFKTKSGGNCRIRVVCQSGPQKSSAQYRMIVYWGKAEGPTCAR